MEENVKLQGLIVYAYNMCKINKEESNKLFDELEALYKAKALLDSRKMKPKFLVGEEVYAIDYKSMSEPIIKKVLIESIDWYDDKKKFHYNYCYYEDSLFRSLDDCKKALYDKYYILYKNVIDKIDGIIKYFNEKEGDN